MSIERRTTTSGRFNLGEKADVYQSDTTDLGALTVTYLRQLRRALLRKALRERDSHLKEIDVRINTVNRNLEFMHANTLKLTERVEALESSSK